MSDHGFPGITSPHHRVAEGEAGGTGKMPTATPHACGGYPDIAAARNQETSKFIHRLGNHTKSNHPGLA